MRRRGMVTKTEKIFRSILTVATLISYNADEQAVLFDILYDRYERKSTIIVSQKSPVMWIKEMQGTTLAESSVNRATHNNWFFRGSVEALKII